MTDPHTPQQPAKETTPTQPRHQDTAEGAPSPTPPQSTEQQPQIGFHYGYVSEQTPPVSPQTAEQPTTPHHHETAPPATSAGAAPTPQQPAATTQPQTPGNALWNQPGIQQKPANFGRVAPQQQHPSQQSAPQHPHNTTGDRGTTTKTKKTAGRGVVDNLKQLPEGWPVGSFDTYSGAQAAVDMLSDTGDFPVKDLTIVGLDLMEVEKVTDRLTTGKVIMQGAAAGAWMGLFFGLLVSFFQPTFAPIIAGLLMGIVFGVISAVVPYLMTRGHRDFASTREFVARRYDVICKPDSARRARDLIAQWSTSHR
ncbi:hypothetical protein CCHOA_04300 [Corynebacterium choanae]|uniref:General stress protein 17M-like domain-containing protein n=1 Tax=Corynebacterium choanae TaxID=1862358 RepID=A0A3G6J5P7_9CORY|nr:hypothetical protein CCHOA_04300 [Corynebacterium choanae]